jgi:hypothetical protein
VHDMCLHPGRPSYDVLSDHLAVSAGSKHEIAIASVMLMTPSPAWMILSIIGRVGASGEDEEGLRSLFAEQTWFLAACHTEWPHTWSSNQFTNLS